MLTVIVAIGGNTQGWWGSPPATFSRALDELVKADVRLLAASRLYRSRPVGLPRQPWFWNGAVTIESGRAPAELLRLLKRIERKAGRRRIGTLGARPLDLDLIDARGARYGGTGGHRDSGRLVLPHPQAHVRPFVLIPIRDIAAGWHHPRLRAPLSRLLARLGPTARDVRPALDPAARSWEKRWIRSGRLGAGPSSVDGTTE